jgi:hypothetical protein
MTDQLPTRTPAGDAPAIDRPLVVTAVCDPQAPAAFRRWARRQRPCLDTRGNLVALTPGGSSRGTRPAAAGGWLLAVGCLVMLFVDPLPAAWVAWLAAALVSAISGATVQIRSSRPDLELTKTTVVFPENLDDPCRALLGRAQSAISIVLGSPVRAAGLLGHPVDDALLREREWEIASKLREITTLRTLHQANTAGRPAGPMTSDVLGRQRRAIELAQEGITSLVLALERYASQIVAADEAERDWQRATELSELNDKYLDLVAGTAADDFATEEIAGMTEQLAAATRTRSDRLHDADLAARALELP